MNEIEVPLRFQDKEIGKAFVSLDLVVISAIVLDPEISELLQDPDVYDLYEMSIFAKLAEVKYVVMIPKESKMSDENLTQPEEPKESPSLVVGATDDESADQIAQESRNDGNVGPGNPTQESDDSTPTEDGPVPESLEISSLDNGDASDPSENSTEQPSESSNDQVDSLSDDQNITMEPASTSDLSSQANQSGDTTSAETSTENSPITTTEPSNPSEPTTYQNSTESTTQPEDLVGIVIMDVDGSNSSNDSEDGSELGDPEFPDAPTPQEPIWPSNEALPDGVEASQVEIKSLLTEIEISNRFGFHKTAIEGANVTSGSHSQLRKEFINFANWLNDGIPASREAALMFTALEEASMWAHKAIAQSNPLVEE